MREYFVGRYDLVEALQLRGCSHIRMQTAGQAAKSPLYLNAREAESGSASTRCIYVRLICGVVGILAAAVLAGPLHAVDLPTPPPAPLPALPLPAPPLVPLPPLPLTPPPASPAPAPQLPSPPGPPAASTVTPVPTAAGRSAPITPVRSSGTTRSGAAGKRPFRPVVKRFRLAHAGRVRVTVREIYPDCRTLHSFAFAGRKGRNALRLPKRIATKVGTYQLVAHAHGHKLFSVQARVLRGRHLLIDRGSANACDAAQVEAVALTATVSNQESQGVASAHERRSALPQSISHPPRDTNPLVRAVTLTDVPAAIRPLLFVLLALAICLLGAAALPQTMLPAGPMAGALTQRRIYVAAAGIWLLAVVIVVTLVS